MWIKQEQALHINVLQLLGAKLVLLSFFKDNKDIKQIRVMMDNNTAVPYINNMGGIRSDLCDDIAFDTFDIWQWAAEQQLWISAAHIPGSENVIADKNSRMFGNLRRTCSNRLLLHLVIQILIYLHLE